MMTLLTKEEKETVIRLIEYHCENACAQDQIGLLKILDKFNSPEKVDFTEEERKDFLKQLLLKAIDVRISGEISKEEFSSVCMKEAEFYALIFRGFLQTTYEEYEEYRKSL